MAVRKESNGSWTVDYRYFDISEQKRKRYWKRGFKTKREAEQYEFILKNSSNEVTSANFEFYLDDYLTNSNSSASTKLKKKQVIKDHAPTILNANIEKLTKKSLLVFRDELGKKDISTTYKNMILTYVKSVLKYAHEVHGTPSNYGVLQPFKKRYDEHKEMQVWTVEEFNKFIDCIDNPIYNAYFTLLFQTGMRRSEAKALLKSDITNNRYVNICKSMKHGEDTTHEPKTKHSKRKIKIDELTYTKLEILLRRQGKWLFGDYEPIGITSIQRHFKNGIKLSGVKEIRIHDLRHSHATILINAGANIVAVSKRLGHSDINMTLKTYTHLLEETNQELMDILENGSKVVAK